MNLPSNRYLKFTSLSKTVFWDYYSLNNENAVHSLYPLVKLKEVLIHRKKFITINEESTYKRCRVQVQGKGVVLRDEVSGKEIKTKKQQLCNVDDFLVAEIDAKVGGYGIVPAELEGAIVSGHYFLFEIDKAQLLPDFLGLVVKQRHFSKQVKSAGSTNYAAIRPYHVLNYQIPLPSLTEQKRVVDHYQKQILEAHLLLNEAKNLEEEIERVLFAELGVIINASSAKNRLLQFVNFRDISRWDTLSLLGKLPSLTTKFELIKFNEIIKYFNKDQNNKPIRIDTSKFPEKVFKYIGMENIEKDTGNLLKLPEVKGKEIKSQTLFVPKNFFIYGKLRPYLNKYWINNSDYDNIVCSSEFFVFDICDNINQQFFKHVLSSKIIQNQISDKTSGARMPRINEEIFLNLQFPLPSKEIQNKIADIIDSIKIKIEKFKNQAIEQNEFASIVFEHEIFGQ